MFDGIVVAPFVSISRRDPYRGYARLRRLGAVYEAANHQFWITGHSAATAALKEIRLERHPAIAEPHYTEHKDKVVREFAQSCAVSMLHSNPPEHARRRGFMARAFQHKIIERLRASTTAVCAQLFEDAARRGPLDAIEAVASPLPVHVISHLVGVPKEDWARCVAWSGALAPMVDPFIPGPTFQGAVDAGMEFAHYLLKLMEARRAEPKDDILTQLVEARDSGQELTDAELISNIITLFIGGHETTTNTIGHALVLFTRFPETRAAVTERPELITQAVEEVLRYEPAIQTIAQRASEDLVVESTTIPRGARTWVLLGAANRDPERFDDPETFDVQRSPNPHLTFGGGTHVCIGAALARLELQVALGMLFERYPNWKLLEQDFELRPTTTFRGYQRLAATLR